MDGHPMEIMNAKSKRGGWRPGSGRKPKAKLPFHDALGALERVREQLDTGINCLRGATMELAAVGAALLEATPLLNAPGPAKTIRPQAAAPPAADIPRDVEDRLEVEIAQGIREAGLDG